MAHLLFWGMLFIWAITTGCRSDKESDINVPTRDIKTVMEAHTSELMAIAGVVGVAIGENEKKKPCIMVLIIEDSDEIRERIPKEIEGHPVCPFVSGEIKPMSGN